MSRFVRKPFVRAVLIQTFILHRCVRVKVRTHAVLVRFCVSPRLQSSIFWAGQLDVQEIRGGWYHFFCGKIENEMVLELLTKKYICYALLKILFDVISLYYHFYYIIMTWNKVLASSDSKLQQYAVNTFHWNEEFVYGTLFLSAQVIRNEKRLKLY